MNVSVRAQKSFSEPARWVLVTGALLAALAGRALAADRPLPLAEAIAMALSNNEAILVQREGLVAAEAAVGGARGAYDPLLELSGGWRDGRRPVNSSFSGAPAGRLAPKQEVIDATAGVSQLLPTGGSVALRGTSARGKTDSVFQLLSPAYDTGLGVEFRQPLLRDRAIDPARFGLKVAAADRELAAADLRRQLMETVAAVERSYWTLTATRRELSVREEALRLAQDQLGETEHRIEAGASPETEVAQPRAELERRRGELLASREAATRAENALKLLILGDTDTTSWGDHLVPSEDAAPAVSSVDVVAAMTRALESRPELAALEAVIDRRKAETALAKDAVRPSFDAVLAYERFGLAGTRNRAASGSGTVPSRLDGGFSDSLDLLRDGDLDEARVGLVFAVPIGNRRARAGAAIAKSVERQAEADLTLARKEVRTEVLDAVAALDTAGQRIEAAKAAREAAEVQLMAERERFGAGISTNFLVLTRQNDLSRARLDEIAAQTDYRQAAVDLARTSGVLLEERGIAIDGIAIEEGGSAASPGTQGGK